MVIATASASTVSDKKTAKSAKKTPTISKLPIEVSKPTPYTFDLGLLLAQDPNPLPVRSDAPGIELEETLAATARDGAQALLNQMLSTCAIASTPNGVLMSLPAVETALPREKVRIDGGISLTSYLLCCQEYHR